MESIYLMNEGKVRATQKLLERARKLEPNHPGILNNLAKCLESLGDAAGAEKIMVRVVEEFPDYFFGQIGLANKFLLEGDLDKAEEILAPLQQRRKLHYSEFFGLADTQIRFQLALDQVEGAERWLDMWRQVEPDHPQIRGWERQLGRGNGGGIGQALADLLKQPLARSRRRKREP